MPGLSAFISASLWFGVFIAIAFAFYCRGDGVLPFKTYLPGGWGVVVVYLVALVVGFLYFSGCVA